MDETHVEHAVGFVEHEDFDAIEMNGAALHKVEQPSGRCHQHIDPVRERADLTVDGHAADGQCHPWAQIASVGLEAVDDLSGQFARWAQHQYAATAWLRAPGGGAEVIENGKREGCGLAGAGLRDADDVPCREHLRDGLGLNRGRSGILLVDERTGDGLAESEIEKGGQSGVFRVGETDWHPQCSDCSDIGTFRCASRLKPTAGAGSRVSRGNWTPRVVWAVDEFDAG